MLPLTAAGAAGASAATNPIKATDAIQSRDLVIAAASFGAYCLNFLPLAAVEA
jgi:hypothetical protein